MQSRCLLLFILFFMAVPIGQDVFTQLNRAPSSTPSSCYEMLASFYTSDRNTLLKTRIANAKDDLHLFYRSFPPLFYKIAEQYNWNQKFSAVSGFASIMAGDAHMENFGLKYFKGKLRLSVNDYDDLTNGPLFLDFLRLITSARLAGVEVDKEIIENALKAYKKGLKGDEWQTSKVTEDLFKKARQQEIIDPHMIDSAKKVFIKKKEPYSELNGEELERWQKVLNDFGKIKDSYLFTKQYGGSAGLERYQFLVEKDGDLKWIEAKEWSGPSFNVAVETESPADLKRYEAIVTYDKPFVTPKLAKVKSKTFYLRNIDGRQLGIEIAGHSKKELIDILMDEFYALGDFHQYFLKNKKEYSSALHNSVSIDDIREFVKMMKDEMKASVKSL